MELKKLQSRNSPQPKNLAQSQFTSCQSQGYSWSKDCDWTDSDRISFNHAFSERSQRQSPPFRQGNIQRQNWKCQKEGLVFFVQLLLFDSHFSMCEVEVFPFVKDFDSYPVLFFLCAIQIVFNVDLFRTDFKLDEGEGIHTLHFDGKLNQMQHSIRYNLNLSADHSFEVIKKAYAELHYLKSRQKNLTDLANLLTVRKPHPLIRLLNLGRKR